MGCAASQPDARNQGPASPTLLAQPRLGHAGSIRAEECHGATRFQNDPMVIRLSGHRGVRAANEALSPSLSPNVSFRRVRNEVMHTLSDFQPRRLRSLSSDLQPRMRNSRWSKDVEPLFTDMIHEIEVARNKSRNEWADSLEWELPGTPSTPSSPCSSVGTPENWALLGMLGTPGTPGTPELPDNLVTAPLGAGSSFDNQTEMTAVQSVCKDAIRAGTGQGAVVVPSGMRRAHSSPTLLGHSGMPEDSGVPTLHLPSLWVRARG